MNQKISWDETIVWDKSICRWDEGIPLGSGRCGCLCWGTAKELRFSLDRTDLWDRTQVWKPSGEFTYEHMVRLALDGEEDEIRRIFDAPYYYPTPTKLPAGKIFLRFCGAGAHDGVKSRLHMNSAHAHLQVQAGAQTWNVCAWIHALEHVGMIETDAPSDAFCAELCCPGFGGKGTEKERAYDKEARQITQGTLKDLHYDPAVYQTETYAGLLMESFSQEITEDFSYGIVTAMQARPDKTRIAWKIVSSQDGEQWFFDGKRAVAEALLAEETRFFAEHAGWWRTYFEKSSISLPDCAMEQQWYLANYLFAGASRKGSAPMPLQGVWTADDGTLPPWKGDYHHDLNTELSYSHYLKANHLEEGESFLDFLWKLRDAGRTFAKEFYRADGCCLPGVMTIDGKPLGGWGMYSLSPTNQIWISRCFGEYYRYTGDRDFLKNRAYPYLRETGVFVRTLLRENENGYLTLPISSSPEIHDDTIRAWFREPTNYDLALLRYLFSELEMLAKELGFSEAAQWAEIYRRLPSLALNEKHVLMLAPGESLEESHRHFSNAMAISPLEQLLYEEEGKTVIDAVIRDYERLGTRNWVGYTFAWMAHLYAVAGDGEHAREMLSIFWNCFCGPNGFHLNGDYRAQGYSDFTYRPFTLEGNMFAADALQEMLFQMRGAQITLFPAAPEAWLEQGVAFDSLRGEKGMFCSARITQEKLTWKVEAGQACTLTVRFRDAVWRRELQAKEVWCEALDLGQKQLVRGQVSML